MKSCLSFSLGEGSRVYQEIRYPAGELQVRLNSDWLGEASRADSVRVTAHIANGDDLVRLALLASAVRGVSRGAEIELLLPYLPYARADRRFTVGDCFGLESFAALLAAMRFDRIGTLDAHSATGAKLIPNLLDVSPLPLITSAIARFARHSGRDLVTVLFPDEGARARYTLPESVGNNHEQIGIQVLQCRKKREPASGKLSGFEVPRASEFQSKCALIVDDICDGGGTFLGIANELSAHRLNLGLYVSHGIFSKGLDSLKSQFSMIYTTDSMGVERYDDHLHTFECGPLLAKALNQGVNASGATLP